MVGYFGPHRDKIAPSVVKKIKNRIFAKKMSIIFVKLLSYMVFTTTKCISCNMTPFSHAMTLKTAHKQKLGPRKKCVFLRNF